MRFFARWLLAATALACAAPQARAADPLVIGFDIELTGGLAPNGKAALLAMQIWAEEINAKGGLLGRPVKLLYYDDQSNPATVPGIITKLLDVDHVDLLIGGNGTNMLAPAMPVVMQRNLTFLGLFGLDVNSEFHYPKYFSIIPAGGPTPKEAFSQGFFAVAATLDPKPKTIALVGADAEFSRNAVDGARAQAKRAGYTIVYDQSYPPTTADYSPIVRAIQAASPDLVFVGSYPPDTVGMVRAANEVGLKAKLFGGGMVGLQATAIKTATRTAAERHRRLRLLAAGRRLRDTGSTGIPGQVPGEGGRGRRRCAGLLPAAVRLFRHAGVAAGGRRRQDDSIRTSSPTTCAPTRSIRSLAISRSVRTASGPNRACWPFSSRASPAMMRNSSRIRRRK